MTKFPDLPEKSWLRPDEVATFCRVSVRTVYRWIDEEKLTVRKYGRKSLRIYRDSVVRLGEGRA